MKKLICFILWLSLSQACALTSDRDQPISIEADQLEYDHATGVSIYRGNVMVEQGSMTMQGDVLTVTVVNQQAQSMQLTSSANHKAELRQTLDNQQKLKALARQIDYTADTEVIVLTGAAELYRDEDVIRSRRIQYLMQSDRVLAGQQSQPYPDQGPSDQVSPDRVSPDRVKIILTPARETAR